MNTLHAVAVVFDFDGVIVPNSETIKLKAWDYAFADMPAAMPLIATSIEKYRDGRGSRFNIIQDILEKLSIPHSCIEEFVVRHAERYDEYVQKGIQKLDVDAETRELLTELSADVPLFINTATPTAAIEITLQRLGIRHFFRGVYGMPGSKEYNLRSIQEQLGVSMQEILFIGDGKGDAAAARGVGCRFIGYSNVANGWSKEDFPLVYSLPEIRNYIYADKQ